jgi:hypothetical protein
MQKACQTIKGSVTGNTDLDNYILSNQVAPATDADVHALCTKPQFDGFFRKSLEDFPLSSIFNTAGFVHSACTSASVAGAT